MSDGVALSISQFVDAWSVFGHAHAGSRLEHAAGVDFIFTGLPIPFFNVAVATGRELSAASLESQARAATAWASDKNAPWLFIVTLEALEPGANAEAILDGCGLAPLLPMTGMVARHMRPAARSADGVQLEVPQDDAACAAIIDINSAAYEMDLGASKPTFGTTRFWNSHVGVLGRAGGAPATSAAVMMVDGYRYVALVATDPAFRQRGFAEAAMRRALDVAAQRYGECPTFLHATDAGRPIYARMGYEPVASHLCFVDKRFLAGH
jgi:ribosomal protein S18 acetylase RimI-like enzyme